MRIKVTIRTPGQRQYQMADLGPLELELDVPEDWHNEGVFTLDGMRNLLDVVSELSERDPVETVEEGW